MRVVPYKRGLPRRWSGMHPGIVAEFDVRVFRSGRLRAKVLVFKNKKALRSMWTKRIGHDLGHGTIGAVNGLACETSKIERDGSETNVRIRCDPRYFCVIGLVEGCLSMEIVTHESVHAAYCYYRRRKGNFWPNALELDEENIAYPAGRIARAINIKLYELGLYD